LTHQTQKYQQKHFKKKREREREREKREKKKEKEFKIPSNCLLQNNIFQRVWHVR
jgi:hypothetical protein